MIAWVIAQLVIAVAWEMVRRLPETGVLGQGLKLDGGSLALSTLGGLPVAIGCCWLFAWLRRGMPAREYHGLRWPGRRALLVAFGVLVAAMVLSDALTLALGRPLVPEVMVETDRSAGGLAPLYWLAIVMGAPLGEEMVFRGFVFEGLSRSRLGGLGTVALTSLVWAGIHLQYDFYGMATIFVTGLLLGAVRLKTGSIYLTGLMHAFINLVTMIEVQFLLHFRG